MRIVRKQPKILVRGRAAVVLAGLGAPLWVLGLDGYWVPALPGTYERAKRMADHAVCIYGVTGSVQA